MVWQDGSTAASATSGVTRRTWPGPFWTGRARARAAPATPRRTALPTSVLAQAAGATITPNGIGGHAALQIFAEVLSACDARPGRPDELRPNPSAPPRRRPFERRDERGRLVDSGRHRRGAIARRGAELAGLPPRAAHQQRPRHEVCVARWDHGRPSALRAALLGADRRAANVRPAVGWSWPVRRAPTPQSQRYRGPRHRSDPRAGGRRGPSCRPEQDPAAALDGVDEMLATPSSRRARSTNERIVDDLASHRGRVR